MSVDAGSLATGQPIVVVFPGQGAQAPGLGLAWREHASWHVVEQAEKAVDRPLAHLLLDAPAEDLTRTDNAQLCVLLASLMAWDALRAVLGESVLGDRGAGERAVGFAGHSLGQVTALIAAGALPFDEGLRLAVRRAELTQEASQRRPGRMAALLGATPEQAEAACAGIEGCWVANDNAPGQVVIAGTPEGVDAATTQARGLGVRKVLPINVGGAFHTPLMADAAEGLRPLLASAELRDTEHPVVGNTDGVAHTDGEGWRIRLADHLVQPVRWRQSMDTLAGLAPQWVEVGPGALLAAMAKRGRPEVTVRNVAGPDDVATLPEIS